MRAAIEAARWNQRVVQHREEQEKDRYDGQCGLKRLLDHEAVRPPAAEKQKEREEGEAGEDCPNVGHGAVGALISGVVDEVEYHRDQEEGNLWRMESEALAAKAGLRR